MPIESERISNYIKIIPAHLRPRSGTRIANPRWPLYWLDSVGGDIYFINNTDETLVAVSTMTNGYLMSDDEVLPMTGEDLEYKNVLPNEAVKLDYYDEIYDSDFSFQMSLNVISPSHGNLHFLFNIDMNNCRSKVLVWSTGEEGKYVSMTGAIEVAVVAESIQG